MRTSVEVYRRPEFTPAHRNPAVSRVRYKASGETTTRSLPRHRVRRSRVFLGFLIALGFVLSGAIGAVAYFMPAIVTAFQDTGHAIDRNFPTAKASASASASAAASAPAVQAPPGQPFTVLLLGSDNDAKFGGTILTQSMILARVNPKTRQVVMESIPRDLWVPLSSGGSAKIDAAYLHGGPECGCGHGRGRFPHPRRPLRVDRPARSREPHDQVGGIDVVATNPVMDDFYPKDLTGKDPYAYERVRSPTGSATHERHAGAHVRPLAPRRPAQRLGRSQRQQQVLLALRAKAKLLGIADLPDIATAMANDFSTDMSIGEIASLLPIASSLQLQNVQQVILASPYSTPLLVGNQDALQPNWNLILPLTHRYFPAV